jgi:hypothetical protein
VTGGVGTWNVVSVSGTPGLSTEANLNSVFMLSPTSGWAVGGIAVPGITDGPIIIYWDGTKWTPVAAPTIPGGITATGHTSGVLKSVYFTGPNDGWAAGYPGKLVANVLHWNGFSWNHVTLSPALLGEIPPILASVYMTSESSGWIVGASPDFKSATYYSGPGFKHPLSTMLRFAPFGGVFSQTTTAISTVATSTTEVATSTTSTVTFTTNVTTTNTVTTAPPSQGIPGFPVESIIAGIVVGIVTLGLVRHRRKSSHSR